MRATLILVIVFSTIKPSFSSCVLSTKTRYKTYNESFEVKSMLTRKKEKISRFNKEYEDLFSKKEFIQSLSKTFSNYLLDRYNKVSIDSFYNFEKDKIFETILKSTEVFKVSASANRPAFISCLNQIDYDYSFDRKSDASSSLASCLDQTLTTSKNELNLFVPNDLVKTLESNELVRNFIKNYVSQKNQKLNINELIKKHREFTL